MNWRITALVAALVIALTLLFWRPFDDAEPVEQVFDPQQLQPDFIAEGLNTRIFTADGHLQHEIQSERMAHYSVIGLTELTEPVYMTTVVNDISETNERWRVSAEKGSFYDDQRLTLDDSVNIFNLSEAGFVQSIETEFLLIDTQRQHISTDQPVRITGPHLEVHGLGMQVDLNAQQLELTEHVTTIYYPERATQ